MASNTKCASQTAVGLTNKPKINTQHKITNFTQLFIVQKDLQEMGNNGMGIEYLTNSHQFI